MEWITLTRITGEHYVIRAGYITSIRDDHNGHPVVVQILGSTHGVPVKESRQEIMDLIAKAT